MSKAAKSQIDTFSKTQRISITKFAVIVMLASLPVHSVAAPKCELYFGSSIINKITAPIKNLGSRFGFKPKSSVELTEQQATELAEFINKDEFRRPYGVSRGTNPMFWYMWDLTPPEIKETIILILDSSQQKNLRDLRGNILEVLEKNKITSDKQDSFFETLVSAWGDKFLLHENSSETFAQWITEGHQKFLEDVRQNKVSPDGLRKIIERSLQYKNANDNWDKHAGVNTLKIKRIDNQDMVEIKDKWYKCQIDAANNNIKILVPRDLVRRAAWNPLYTEVLTKKIAEGARPLKYYDGFLAANAYFYLSDGNHRFHIDTRPEVWIQMSYPAKTASYRISFDAMGIRQPDIEVLHKFNTGESSLTDLIGPEAAKLFFFH